MSRYLTRGRDLRQGFFAQLGLFLVLNAAAVIYTLAQSGDFWWIPVTVIWGGAVAGYGAITYLVWRRDRWEDDTGEQRQRLFVPPNPLD